MNKLKEQWMIDYMITVDLDDTLDWQEHLLDIINVNREESDSLHWEKSNNP